jgi:hypothetical protein
MLILKGISAGNWGRCLTFLKMEKITITLIQKTKRIKTVSFKQKYNANICVNP